MDTVVATITPSSDTAVSKSTNNRFIVRKARRDDMDDVLEMIQVTVHTCQQQIVTPVIT